MYHHVFRIHSAYKFYKWSSARKVTKCSRSPVPDQFPSTGKKRDPSIPGARKGVEELDRKQWLVRSFLFEKCDKNESYTINIMMHAQYMPIIFMTHWSFWVILSSHIGNLSQVRVICICHDRRTDVLVRDCMQFCMWCFIAEKTSLM